MTDPQAAPLSAETYAEVVKEAVNVALDHFKPGHGLDGLLAVTRAGLAIAKFATDRAEAAESALKAAQEELVFAHETNRRLQACVFGEERLRSIVRTVFECDGRMVSISGGPTEWRALHEALKSPPFFEAALKASPGLPAHEHLTWDNCPHEHTGCLDCGAPGKASPPVGMTREAIDKFADAVVLRVCELPDRTSPEDWPEALLVTSKELHFILVDQLTADDFDGLTRLTAQAVSPASTEGWKPISDYPKDSLRRLTWSEGCGRCVAFIDATGAWWPVPAHEPLEHAPTFWAELPEPPWDLHAARGKDHE
jgi:hypothetical protein